MKVRQSVSVTSELGDQNNLASFDGEILEKSSSSRGFWFDASSFLDSSLSLGAFKRNAIHPHTLPRDQKKYTRTQFLSSPASIE